MHIIFGWHTQAHIIGHAATVNLSRVHSVCVASRGLRIQGPARAPGPSCTTWGVIVSPLDARGAVSGIKSEKSAERKEQPEDLYTDCFWSSLSSPHIRGIGRVWFVGLPADPVGVFFPPGGAAFGASWIRVAPFFGNDSSSLRSLYFGCDFFFSRETICKVSQEAETMFCRNQTARATVARGSALEMEIRRGKFRKSVFQDTSQVQWLSASYHTRTNTHTLAHSVTSEHAHGDTRCGGLSVYNFDWSLSFCKLTYLAHVPSLSEGTGVCVLLCAPF